MNRPDDIRPGYTRKVPFGCGTLYLTINNGAVTHQPTQVLAQLGKAGCCQRAMLESVLRLVNMLLDDGKPVTGITAALSGVRCDQGMAGVGRLSCVDAVAQELKRCSLGEAHDIQVQKV